MPGNISESQRHILEYMQDDELFNQPQPEPGYGLEEDVRVPSHSFDISDPEEPAMLEPEINLDAPEEPEEQEEPLMVPTYAGHGEPVKTTEAAAEPPAAEIPPKRPEKPTNNQAAGTSLTPEEINDDQTVTVRPYKIPPVDLLKKGKAPQNKAGTQVMLRA